MYCSFPFFLVVTATILDLVATLPIPTSDASIPVMPGGVDDLIITAQNTLNATNLAPIPSDNRRTFAIQSNARLPLDIVNNLGGSISAYVTGLDSTGRIVFLQPNGQFMYPAADATFTIPREVSGNLAIPLCTSKGCTTRVTLPDYITAARIWFARGNLHFYSIWAGSGPGQVQPSFANPRDPSAGIDWGFVELTHNSGGLYANISYVDFVGLALGMSVVRGDGSTSLVQGLHDGAVSNICAALAEQQSRDGQPWSDLCQSINGRALRAVAPFPHTASHPTAFSNYWASYIDQVWNTYRSAPLTIDTQSGAGRVVCKVTDGVHLSCDGDNRGYAKPSAADIFGCNSGPFAIQSSDNPVHRAVVPRLCAAFNRGTLLANGGDVQPGPHADTYYQTRPNNRYSGIVHRNLPDGRGYAFSYDDVNPTGGIDQSGTLAEGNPRILTVYVGGA